MKNEGRDLRSCNDGNDSEYSGQAVWFLGQGLQVWNIKGYCPYGGQTRGGENVAQAGVSAKKIEATGKATGYAMVGGATMVATHSMTSESRAKGNGIDNWNKRMEEQFEKLPPEEQKEIMKDVIGKNFEIGWGEVAEFFSTGCLLVVFLLVVLVMRRKLSDRQSRFSGN